MVENPLAFEFSKTRAICDAFDAGSWQRPHAAPKSLATQTILAKRIMKMADQGLRDIPALRDDALAFLQHSPPSASRDGLGEAIKAPAAALAVGGRLPEGDFSQGQPGDTFLTSNVAKKCRALSRQR